MSKLSKPQQDALKKQVAVKALEFLPEGEIIGVGTGSTVNFFIEALASVKDKIKGAVSSSDATTSLLKKYEIPTYELSEVTHLAAYFDGADEINHSLQMIKGGGGALVREKIVATVADKFICLADETKYVSRLGAFPLPVEVLPIASSYVAKQLLKLGASPQLRLDFISDNGNKILDCTNFYVDEPLKMEKLINEIVGVVDCGIFARRPADLLILAKASGVEVIKVS